ncbi:hypothetical protein HPB47_015799, partial [Ixodes persulcatus]
GTATRTAAPFISLAVAGKEFAALLDSGASASLIEDEVLRHLQQKSVRVKHGETTFHLACGSTTPRRAVRLVVRWNQRALSQRFVHLAWLTVPIILGRDFPANTGIIICRGNFRESSTVTMAAALGKAKEQERTGRDDATSHPTPSSVAHCDAMSHPMANSDGLSRPEQERLAALLHNFDEMFTEQPGCTKQVQHRSETGDARTWERPVSLAKRKAIDAALDELLESDSLFPGRSLTRSDQSQRRRAGPNPIQPIPAHTSQPPVTNDR